MATPIVGQNERLDPVEIKAELDPKFWSLKSTGTNEKYPPQLIETKNDVLVFQQFAHLREYPVATKWIVTNYTASTPVANETFPRVERVVVNFEVQMPISWSFHDILVELLPVIKEAGTLKGVILLVVRQSLQEREVEFLRIDEDLKKLVDESPDVYPPPMGVYMPRVTCMTMETFESTFGWYGLGHTDR
ncbi:hypothetical protein EAF00_006348 [Botryotinia globosa]|nr:hypothetical protein EAF00_006348 [Botryotinia globosa]